MAKLDYSKWILKQRVNWYAKEQVDSWDNKTKNL